MIRGSIDLYRAHNAVFINIIIMKAFVIRIEKSSLDYNAVFIRAPAIQKVWGSCKVMATFEDNIVLARQGNLLVATFHPELTDNTAIHRLLLEMIINGDFKG